jgi:hypothetical protein
MASRNHIHAEFVARFHIGDPPSPATDREIDRIGTELNTAIPAVYRRFMTQYGPVSATKAYWSAGMPSDVIGVASDCMGNLFGFRRQTGTIDDAPVVFFDHDFVEVSEMADSFDEFLQWYLDNIDGR